MNPAAFVAEALSDFATVGAIAPCSRYLTRAMLRPLPTTNARVVIELGPGTGVMTRALLDLLPFDATLLAFEINPRFARHLRSTISDPRLVVIHARASASGGVEPAGIPARRCDTFVAGHGFYVRSAEARAAERNRCLPEEKGHFHAVSIFAQLAVEGSPTQ